MHGTGKCVAYEGSRSIPLGFGTDPVNVTAH